MDADRRDEDDQQEPDGDRVERVRSERPGGDVERAAEQEQNAPPRGEH
jgi:hypothetical protein